MRSIIFILIPLILTTACVNNNILSKNGLIIEASVDPDKVFPGTDTTLFVDIKNEDVKSYQDIEVDVFDTGAMIKTDCPAEKSANYLTFVPGQSASIHCNLRAPQTNNAFTTDINVRTTFSGTLNAAHLFGIMTETFYKREKLVGTFDAEPRKYLHRDENIELEIEFSENPPLIIRPGKKYYVHFTLRNVGNGFINDITQDKFNIRSNPDIIKCDPFEPLKAGALGKSFPRLTCEIDLPEGEEYLKNALITSEIQYRYETRRTVPVSIVK